MPEQHGTGAVSLWTNGLPIALRARDDTGELKALVRVADGQLQDRYDEVKGAFSIWDPLTCEARWLPVLARHRGWRLNETLPVGLQRKIVAVLVSLYRQKGTRPGLINAVRLFLGEEARVRAAWADGWRMGHAMLGGYRTQYTAVGGETEVDLSIDGSWTCTPHVSRVRVWRNGVELAETAFLPTDRTTLAMLTQGTRYVAAAGETRIYLDFVYNPLRNALVVTRNGRRVDQPGVWTEFTSGPYTGIDFVAPLAAGDVIVVHNLESRTPLTAGDVIQATTDDVLTTRLAPPNDGSGPSFQFFLELPRTLTNDEVVALAEVVEMMQPATMYVTVRAVENDRPRWVLGSSILGRGSRLAP
jgi:phage tail-like protein